MAGLGGVATPGPVPTSIMGGYQRAPTIPATPAATAGVLLRASKLPQMTADIGRDSARSAALNAAGALGSVTYVSTSAPKPTAAATTGASAVTSKTQYPTTGGVTTPDQGGGVGGVSPATNTTSGTASLWRLLGLAALAILVLYLLKSGALKGAGKRRRKA